VNYYYYLKIKKIIKKGKEKIIIKKEMKMKIVKIIKK